MLRENGNKRDGGKPKRICTALQFLYAELVQSPFASCMGYISLLLLLLLLLKIVATAVGIKIDVRSHFEDPMLKFINV